MKRRAWLIKVVGVVQGVGFRPFVHRLAIRLGLSGYVRNKGGVEVEIFVEGEEDALRKFLRALLEEKPPTAEIEDVVVEEVGPRGYRQFVIKRSAYESDLLSIIPPDFSICDQCLKEILDPSSRWYRYPFNSCAWCGPRFTIIEKVPYDRENTSMRDFPLCSICLSEYEDLNNVRRYHAQGISCPICGPKITLFDAEGRRVEVDDPLVEAARLIDEGYIVAVKGIGGFHIAALASDDEVVMELRRRKRRPQKPFAVMALNLEIAGKLIVVDENIAKLLSSYQRPIVVAPRRNDAPVSELVAPGLRTLGVMLAYSGIHYLLLRETKDKFLIMTSGNPPGEPICRDNKEAFVKLKGIVDYFLMHNRRIVNGADDSVIRLTHGMPSFLRRSRGFVPRWIKLPFKLKKPIIAFGAMLSNCGALGIGKYVIPTQYIGDVDNIATLEYLEEALNFLLRAYRVDLRESILVADMHPGYLTRRRAEEMAKEMNTPLILTQHHHAHITSVMVEHEVPEDEEVVGIAIDGVGFGEDGSVWGGEVMIARYDDYIRRGHLMSHPMPGGDRATKYPVRMLIGILTAFMDDDEVESFIVNRNLHEHLPYGVEEARIAIRQAFSRRCPLTSSIGRFLDAMSALLGVCYERTYEGEPAIKLEEYALGHDPLELDYKVVMADGKLIVDTAYIAQQVVELMDHVDRRRLAAGIQRTLGRALGEVALRCLRGDIRTIIVSGGAAVNNFIVSGILESVGNDVVVLTARKLPPGDGGLCVGQVAIAASKLSIHEDLSA